MMKNQMQTFHFDFESKKFEGLGQVVGQQIWIHFQGKNYVVPLSQEGNRSKRRSGGQLAQKNSVAAPMPGKISKILLSEGQDIKVGQVVVVMEAMKMEYTLKSEVEGKIKKVFVQLGDQVQLGQILVEFEVKNA